MELHVYVWWLSEADYKLLTKKMRNKLPEYLADEVRSLEGRSGRGRLWVPSTFGEVEAVWSDENPVCRLLSQVSAGGIVFSAPHIGVLPKNIGVVTDLNCMLLPTCPTCGGVAVKDGDSTYEGVEVYKCSTCRVKCDTDPDCPPWPFLFTICNKEGRPNNRIAVCSPHNHS